MVIKSLLTISTLVVLAGCSLGPKAPETTPETTTEEVMPTDEATMEVPAVEETMPEVIVEEVATGDVATGDVATGEAATDTVNVEIVPNPEY